MLASVFPMNIPEVLLWWGPVRKPYREHIEWVQTDLKGRSSFYVETLCGTIADMLSRDPVKRPSAEELAEQIRSCRSNFVLYCEAEMSS